jgi:S-DNA-T family DNA segregation ATPase FtsK/SpoIIIE
MTEDRWETVATTVACACIAGACAFLGAPTIAHLSPWWPAGLGPAAGLVALLASWHDGRAVAIFRAACWVAAGSWVAVSYVTGPWIPGLWVALAGGAGLALLGIPALPGRKDSTVAGQEGDQPGHGGGNEEWQDRLGRLSDIKGLSVTAVADWPTGTGYDVDGVAGGNSGAGWTDLKRVEEKIANSLHLPNGCGAEVQPGPVRGTWRIRVATVDTLATARLNTETAPLSVNGPLPIGWFRDGRPVTVSLRRECMNVTAKTDGGKTNLLHTVTAGLVRCPDALVWHIDLAGGGLALPWLAPWLEGHAGEPAIDWPATTVEEALLMTEMALQIITDRRRAYHPLMRAQNTDVVPMSADVPEIVIVLDESAEAAGDAANPTLRSNLVRILQLGRTTGVRAVMSTLRFTGGNMPTDAQAQIGSRVLFGVADEAEVGYALGWRVRLDPTSAAHPGCGWIRPSLAAPIEVFRSLHTSPPQVIDRIAIECASRRPTLDAVSAAVPLGQHYAARWDRVLPDMTGEPVSVRPGETARRVPPTVPPGTSPAASPSVSGMDLAGFSRDVRAAADRMLTPEVVGAQFEQLVGSMGDRDEADVLRELAAEKATAPRDRMMAILDAAGPAGLSGPKVGEALATAGHQVPEATLYRWLKAAARDGGYGAWVHPKYRTG